MSSNQKETPILDAVIKIAKRKQISFQTPGHSNGASVFKPLKKIIKSGYYFMDISVCDNVDSLSEPTSFIKKGQELLASAYGVKKSYFLVNGSTVGNIAMMLSAFKEGDKVIVPRNAHKSVVNASIIAKIHPVWVPNYVNNSINIAYNLFEEQVETALNNNPDAKAVFLSSPTYSGLTANIKKISKITQKKGILLLVDEAWGAHFRFCSKLPESATKYADLTINSMHKTLPVSNQGSVLHFNSNKIDYKKVETILGMLQTTSPSYVLLANMDATRKQLFFAGEKIFGELIDLSSYIKKQINKMIYFRSITKEEIPSMFELDPIKITISIKNSPVCGYELEKILLTQFNIQVEASSIDHVLIVLKPGTTKKHANKLVSALKTIEKRNMGEYNPKHCYPTYPNFSNKIVMSPYMVVNKESKLINISNSRGMINSNTISIYPPGIPVLLPGEEISQEIINYLLLTKNKDAKIHGLCADNKIQVIK